VSNEWRARIDKAIEALIKQGPGLAVVAAVTIILTVLHARQIQEMAEIHSAQIHDLRTDFLRDYSEAHAQTLIGMQAQAAALKDVAEALRDHNKDQMRLTSNLESFLRELTRGSLRMVPASPPGGGN
jgi:hypothetical protein